MARKLKTYQTSLGFFDLAIAAPSMKAALEAWGADSNLFHQGAAKESDDPDVIAATMAQPGVVLRRPVGSNGSFGQHAELPTDLVGGETPKKADRKPSNRKQTKLRPDAVNAAAERKAALAYEQEQSRRERERAKAEAARRKDSERRQRAVDRAQSALDNAKRNHAERTAAIQGEMEALEKKLQTEEARWNKERSQLEATLRRAQG
jgi:hypothetical protein